MDSVNKAEGQTQVTLQQTAKEHVPIGHAGSDDQCYATTYHSQPISESEEKALNTKQQRMTLIDTKETTPACVLDLTYFYRLNHFPKKPFGFVASDRVRLVPAGCQHYAKIA